MDIVSSGNHTFEFLRHPYRRHVALQWDDFIALAALSLLALTSIRAYVSRDKQLDDLKSFFVSPQLEDGLAPEQEQPNQPPETRNIAEKLKQSVSTQTDVRIHGLMNYAGERGSHILGFSEWKSRKASEEPMSRAAESLRY